MPKRIIFSSLLCIFLFSSSLAAYFPEGLEDGQPQKVIGTVLFFSPTELNVQSLISDSTRFVYNFKLTEKTKLTGNLEAGKTVSVIYTRKRLNKHVFQLIALSVEVLVYQSVVPSSQY
jgi:hypothetical protein